MRFLPFIGLAAVITTLASCGTMSKEECRVADWGVVGDTDGAAGYEPQSRFADHVKSCAKSGQHRTRPNGIRDIRPASNASARR